MRSLTFSLSKKGLANGDHPFPSSPSCPSTLLRLPYHPKRNTKDNYFGVGWTRTSNLTENNQLTGDGLRRGHPKSPNASIVLSQKVGRTAVGALYH